MSDSADEPDDRIEQLLEELRDLEETVDAPEEQEQLQEALAVAQELTTEDIKSDRISKFTTRDMAEAFIGGLLFALPLLVEGGVFEIAEHFTTVRVAGIPIALLGNIAFVLLVTMGVIYWSDIREVRISHPILGIVPRRLAGVLAVSLLVTVGMMFMWGRAFAGEPSLIEVIARITVVWAAAALGGSLGDILPGESKGYDIRIENFDEIIGED